MKKSIQKLLMAMFVLAATMILMPATDAKAAYGLTQSNPSKNAITVQWSPTTNRNATEYRVYVGNNYSDQTLYKTLPLTTTSITIGNLPAGVERSVSVKYTYISTYDNSVSESTLGSGDFKTIPDKVSNVRQDRWYYYIKQFNVVWDEVQAADSYEYIVYNSKGKKLQTGTTTKYGRNFSYSKKVSNNMVYKVKVRAISEIMGTTYTTPWSEYCYCFTQPRVKSVKATNGKLAIKWDKITGATGYDVYVSTNPKKGYKKVKTVGKNTSSVTVKKVKGKKVKKSKTYYVYVESVKKVGKKKNTSGRLYYWNSKNTGSGYF